VSFSDKSTAGSSNTQWLVDGRDYFYGTYFYYTFYTTGTHTVKLTNTYGTCNASATKTFTVQGAPDTKGFTDSFASFCGVPLTIQFKDTTKGATKWLWYFNYPFNTASSTVQAPSYTYTTEGTYDVSLTVS